MQNFISNATFYLILYLRDELIRILFHIW